MGFRNHLMALAQSFRGEAKPMAAIPAARAGGLEVPEAAGNRKKVQYNAPESRVNDRNNQ